jgi:hypothetical protein
MAHAIEKRVVDKKHRYEPIEVSLPTHSKSAKLPASVWEPSTAGCSMDFNCVQSSSATPDWFSPCPARMHCPAADILVLRGAAFKENLDLVSNLWLGQALVAEHKLVLHLPQNGAVGLGWFVPLHFFPKSGVLVLPVQRVRLASHTILMFQPMSEPVVLPIFNLRGVTAQTFQWRTESACKCSVRFCDRVRLDIRWSLSRGLFSFGRRPL